MKNCTSVVAAVLCLAGIAALATKSVGAAGLAFIIPFSLGPLVVTFFLTFLCWRPLLLSILMAAAVLYTAWFFLAYLEVFHWHPDPQGAITLLFVGIYSLPVMLPQWGMAIWKRKSLTKIL